MCLGILDRFHGEISENKEHLFKYELRYNYIYKYFMEAGVGLFLISNPNMNC